MKKKIYIYIYRYYYKTVIRKVFYWILSKKIKGKLKKKNYLNLFN